MDKDSKRKLIEAATPLFADKGYAAVSIRKLATAAQVNSALITYHFGGKEGLYRAVLKDQFNQYIELIDKTSFHDLSPAEIVKRCIGTLIDFHIKNSFFRKLLYGELSHPTPSFESTVEESSYQLYEILHKILEKGIAEGDFRPDLDPSYTIFMVVGMINYYFMARPVMEKEMPELDDKKFGEQVVEVVFNGISKNRLK